MAIVVISIVMYKNLQLIANLKNKLENDVLTQLKIILNYIIILIIFNCVIYIINYIFMQNTDTIDL